MQAHWTQNDLLANGVKIHYTRTGDGSKPAFVLAHGFSDNGLCWLPVARELEKSYDLILMDARGHGKSARVQPGEVLDAAGDLAGLIHELGLDDPIVGGHSMGANTTATMAARYPGLAKAIVLEDPPWWLPQPAQEGQEAPPPRRRPNNDWLTELRDKSIEAIIQKGKQDNPTWPEIEWQAWAESKKEFDPNFLETMRRPGSEWFEDVPKISCPILLIMADSKDAIVTPEAAQKALSLNKNIQVAPIPGAGHNIRRENFSAYMESVNKFLKTLNNG